MTETQVELEYNTSNIEGGLRQFYVSFNLNLIKYRSLALCTTRNITLTNHKKFDGFSLVTFIEQSFVHHPITMILLYRSPNSPETVFLDMINQLLTLSTVHLILGDFSIDGLDTVKCSRLHKVLHNYEMIVSEPTHLDGAALDHVYLLKVFLYK